MSTIFNSLTLAQQSLQVQQMGLEVSQKNIANVNTAGYTRQRLVTVPGDPNGEEGLISGVAAGSIEALRNRFVDYRISQELQSQGYQDTLATALRQVEAIINSSGSQGLDARMQQFFNSFSQLANAPEDVTLREQVLSSASDLGLGFRNLYDQIQSVRTYQEYFVADTVDEINTLTASFASVNARAAQAIAVGSSEAPELVDQRQTILEKIAALIDVSYFETEGGTVTLVTKPGEALVLGDQSTPLEAVRSNTDGLLHIQLGGADVTGTIQGGKLGGLVSVRTAIGGYLSVLDDMAAALISHVNEQHAAGADFDGVAGGDFFLPFVQTTPGSNVGAARSVQVAITSPNRIAAAGAGEGPGSNSNARRLAAIADQSIFSSETATAAQAYSDLIFVIGRDMRSAEESLTTQGSLLVQLQNQRDSFSGVNLDEEAVNIVRYQKAFEATARYISVLNGLTEDIIKILG